VGLWYTTLDKLKKKAFTFNSKIVTCVTLGKPLFSIKNEVRDSFITR